MQPLDRSLTATLADLPPEWPADPLPAIRAAVRAADEMLVVLDDDPTGTQSVHGISVLTEWSIDMLRAELDSAMPAVYLLTNSRSMPLAQAQALNAEISRNILESGDDERSGLRAARERSRRPTSTGAPTEITAVKIPLVIAASASEGVATMHSAVASGRPTTSSQRVARRPSQKEATNGVANGMNSSS